ncbi:MAG: methyl-accepting chemotaxis protein [Coriobacteriia bacterium]|nr:methyl-accepting chemotaxis protein [Coriobacteriia bacterium]
MTERHRRVRTTVRLRIVLAMFIVVLANLVVGGFASYQYAQAAASASAAAEAQARAGLLAQASQRLTEYFSEATNLALSMKASTSSEEISTEYGGFIGVDQSVFMALGRLEAGLPSEDYERMSRTWEDLRIDVAKWVNTEALSGGTPIRLRRMENGSFRASVETDLYAEEGTPASEMRRAVHVKEEAFRDGLLRGLVRDAEAEALLATRAEKQASELARAAILVSIGVALFVALAMSVWLYRSIATPLTAAKHFSDEVAAGHLEASIVHRTGDEIGALTLSVENMRDAVVRRLDNIRELAGVVLVLTESSTATLAEAEKALAEGESERAAASLTEARATTATLSELASGMLEA